jgi:transposase/IS5 family transposase
MSKAYRAWAPEQSYLLPPSPLEWLPEGHLAFFVLELVGELDLSAIEAAIQQKDPRGTRPYSPRMMTALLLYAYCVGVFSSRKIERATYDDVAFRVLCAGEHPHFTTINSFRLDHRNALAAQFLHVLKLCRRAGLDTVGHVALDGTKIPANASKHKAMSYGRMKQEEQRLAAEIEALLFRADEVDAAEDARYGRGERADDLPSEFQRRDARLKKIREAKEALEREAAEARAEHLRELADVQRTLAETELDPAERKRAATRATKSEAQADKLDPPDDEPPATTGSGLPHHRVPATPQGTPKEHAQRNFTDGDSRIMVRNGVYLQAYNAHAAVSSSQIVVAHAVTNQPPDHDHLAPMLERIGANCGEPPRVLSADTGYFSLANARVCKRARVDAYISIGRANAESLGRLPMTEAREAMSAMREKLVSEHGRAIYSRRKVIVEPVFGQIKGAMRFRRFSLRGLAKVGAEWAIVCLCHNLLKLRRAIGTLAALPA